MENILETIEIDDYHSIEFKKSTWDESEISIRNCYYQENGKFDPYSSSELSFPDLNRLTLETLKRDRFSRQTCIDIIKEAIASLDRREKSSP